MAANNRIQWLHKKIIEYSYPNAMRLAERFNVSHRQAQRDVDFLRKQLGAPIAYDAEHKGFYYTTDFSLPVLVTSDNDESYMGVVSTIYNNDDFAADSSVIQMQMPYTAVLEIPDKLAMDFKVPPAAGPRRIARAAFEYAKNNGKDNVAIVTKANIMKKTDGNFSRICHEVAAEYPGITAEDWYIDIMTANLVNEARRSQFQVFVLPNLYGDIITDEAAQIQGGVGTAGSANIGDRYAMFEAIHGSAPRMIEMGRGDYANPASVLKACAMLLRHIGKANEAEKLEKALAICNEKMNMTGRVGGNTCAEFAQAIMTEVEAM